MCGQMIESTFNLGGVLYLHLYLKYKDKCDFLLSLQVIHFFEIQALLTCRKFIFVLYYFDTFENKS